MKKLILNQLSNHSITQQQEKIGKRKLDGEVGILVLILGLMLLVLTNLIKIISLMLFNCNLFFFFFSLSLHSFVWILFWIFKIFSSFEGLLCTILWPENWWLKLDFFLIWRSCIFFFFSLFFYNYVFLKQ